ncbi:MAG: DUF4838 domain-containing protein, partial [Planctomycetota bacterium]
MWAATCVLAACLNPSTTSPCPADRFLVQDGRSDYKIALHPSATETDHAAARELQHYIEEISCVRIPIVIERSFSEKNLICIGSAGHVEHFPKPIDWPLLEQDGFTLQTNGSRLLIAGGEDRGTLNGVFTFLEDYLGCRKLSKDVTFTPRQSSIIIRDMNRTDVPCFTYREILMPDVQDAAYATWHKLHNAKDRKREWGLYVHTFDDLVPPEIYFEEHPEYFAEVNGERVPNTQLCLTNPDLFRLIVAGLRERMEKNPDARYWSVSQNDTYNPCQCPACRALDEAHGGHSGSLL